MLGPDNLSYGRVVQLRAARAAAPLRRLQRRWTARLGERAARAVAPPPPPDTVTAPPPAVVNEPAELDEDGCRICMAADLSVRLTACGHGLCVGCLATLERNAARVVRYARLQACLSA
jgi:hypothetical protein